MPRPCPLAGCNRARPCPGNGTQKPTPPNLHPGLLYARQPAQRESRARQQGRHKTRVRDQQQDPRPAPLPETNLGNHTEGSDQTSTQGTHRHCSGLYAKKKKNSPNMAASNPSSRAYFEQQREGLMGEIAMVIIKAAAPNPLPAQTVILTTPYRTTHRASSRSWQTSTS